MQTMRRSIDTFFYVILTLLSLIIAAVLALFFRNLLVFGGSVKQLMFGLVGVTVTWSCVSMWMWSLKWRKLDQESYWRFIKGPRPREGEALSAWWWGRQTLYAWLGIMISLSILASVLYLNNG